MPRIFDLIGFGLAPVALAAALLSLDLPLALAVEPYVDGVTPVYGDRGYVNEAEGRAPEGLRIVRVPRHLRFPIELELGASARVLRLLPDESDAAAFVGWDPDTSFAVRVPGRSVTLTRAVSRELPAGTHRLAPGGPLAAAPLLVAGEATLRARSTQSWNRLARADTAVVFVRRNTSKLLGLAALYAGWCAAFLAVKRARARARGPTPLSDRGRSRGPRG